MGPLVWQPAPSGFAGPAAWLPAAPPVDLTREQAQRAAELELSDPAYQAARPGLLQRGLQWLLERVSELAGQAADAAPGGWLGIVGLVLVLGTAALFVRWRLGPVRGAQVLRFTVDPELSAAQYRERAEESAAAGRWEEAISQRMRALVRAGQERGLIDGHPGWTADEVALSIGRQVPACAARLTAAARTFDETRYGGRRGSSSGYRTVADAEEQLLGTRIGQGSAAQRISSAGPVS